MVGNKLKKSSNKSKKVYFMPPCHSLVFISQSDCPFVKKDVKKTFSSVPYTFESCENILVVTAVYYLALPILKLFTKRFILILNEM